MHLDRPYNLDAIGRSVSLAQESDLSGLALRHFHTFAHTAKTGKHE